jgi:hypothetical protein
MSLRVKLRIYAHAPLEDFFVVYFVIELYYCVELVTFPNDIVQLLTTKETLVKTQVDHKSANIQFFMKSMKKRKM